MLAALLRIGWVVKPQTGSHRTLARDQWPDYVFPFHDGEEIGPRMLARVAKRTGEPPVFSGLGGGAEIRECAVGLPLLEWSERGVQSSAVRYVPKGSSSSPLPWGGLRRGPV